MPRTPSISVTRSKTNPAIKVDGITRGYLKLVPHERCTSRLLKSFFFDDARTGGVIDRLKLPRSFTYCWIDALAIDSRWRGRGIARAALDQVVLSHGTKVVFGVGIGYLKGTRFNYDLRLKVYKKLGFKVFVLDGHNYGLRVN